MEFKVECTAANASRFASWIRERGGIAVWTSIDLSRPGEQCSTPVRTDEGLPYTKPHWMYGDTPVIVTDPAQVGVYTETVFKVIPVVLRRSSNGLSLKLADSSQRNLDRVLDRCRTKHGNAHWKRGGLDDRPSMSVFFSGDLIPLPGWCGRGA